MPVNQYKTGAMLSYISIILTNLVGVVLTPFVIRSLGDSEYGLYTLIGSFVTYLSLMDLGLNNTILRFVSRYRAQKDIISERKFLGTTLLIYGVISCVVIILGLIIYFNLDKIFEQSLTEQQLESAHIMFLILIFNAAVVLPGGTFTAICNAYERFVFPRVLTITRYIIRAVTIVTVLKFGGKAISLVVIDTMLNLLMITTSAYYVMGKMKVKFDFKERNWAIVRSIFSYSGWIFLMAITSQFFWHSGQLVLGIKTNTIEVAIYVVGITLGGYYGAFSGAISNLFLPRASKMVIHNTNEELREMLVKIGRICFMILMFILTGFILFGREFIGLWVGYKYAGSWFISLVIMIASTLPLMQTFANSIVEAKNLVRFRFIAYACCLALGITIGVILVPQYKGHGMIIGIASGWIAAQIIMNYLYHFKLKLNIPLVFKNILHKNWLPIVLSVGVGIAINILETTGWFTFLLKGAMYSIVYWGLIYLLGLNQYEKKLITRR